jgi:hypothetical protein
VACGAGLAINLFMHESAWLYPGLARVACKPTPEKPFPLRQLDPTCRLMGWGTTLAQAVDEARQDVRRTGEEAVLAGTSWALPGELGFYCKDHPPVYCVGLPFGDRHSQYDLWTPNPIAQHEAFAGRTFIVVGNYPPEALRAAFAQVEPPRAVTHYVRGQPVAGWVVTIAHGFRGFPCEPAAGAH